MSTLPVQPRVSADVTRRRLRRLSAVAVLAVLAATLAGRIPAEGRDRPGTPNQELLTLCDYDVNTYAPALCGSFNNTASEEVRIEMEATKNGAPFAFDMSLPCKNMASHRVRNADGSTTFVPMDICYTAASTFQRRKTDPDIPYTFETGSVDWSAQYCVRFRARRTSDGVVSEVWSNYACTAVPAPPSAPSRPDFGVSFSGSQVFAPGNATAGDVGKIVPTVMTISPPVLAQSDRFKLDVLGQHKEWRGGDSLHFPFNISQNQPTIDVQLCAYNYSGHSCKNATVDVLAQGVERNAPPPTSLLVPRPAKTLTPNIFNLGGTRGAIAQESGAQLLSARDSAFMVGVDLPGDDYQHQPIDGTAVDCRALCTRDGVCKAWAWVKPGVQNASATCWLKNGVPALRPPNPNVTSGITAARSL